MPFAVFYPRKPEVPRKPKAEKLFSLREVALVFHVQPWKIRRLYERGLLEVPEMIGGMRVVKQSDLIKIGLALAEAGYVKTKPLKIEGIE